MHITQLQDFYKLYYPFLDYRNFTFTNSLKPGIVIRKQHNPNGIHVCTFLQECISYNCQAKLQIDIMT